MGAFLAFNTKVEVFLFLDIFLFADIISGKNYFQLSDISYQYEKK